MHQLPVINVAIPRDHVGSARRNVFRLVWPAGTTHDRRMRWANLVVRGGIVALAVLNLWWGVWGRFAPHHFYENAPGFGRRWTVAYPPYNEHLVTDLGSTFLTLAFLLAAAAVLNDWRLRWVVLAGVLVFNALHLAFHAADRGTMGAFDYGVSLVSLIAGVVIPAVLLVLSVLAGRRNVS